MNIQEFEDKILEAYVKQDRSKLWLSACLMQEAGELAELEIKFDGYGKVYELQKVVDEAGDVLNFLTAILQSHGLSLEDAMEYNISKLKTRGWIK